MASLTKYRKIAPKPPGSCLNEERPARKPVRRCFMEKVKITRMYVYEALGKKFDSEDLPNITRNELLRMKKEVAETVHEKEKIEISNASSGSSYFWKCVLLSTQNWKHLVRIGKKYRVSIWKIRILLQNLNSEKLLGMALISWNNYAKEPHTKELIEMNKKIKDEAYNNSDENFMVDMEDKIEKIDELRNQLEDAESRIAELSNAYDRNVEEGKLASKTVDVLTAKVKELKEIISSHKVEKQDAASQTEGNCGDKVKSLEEKIATLQEENKLLRFARKMQDERFKRFDGNVPPPLSDINLNKKVMKSVGRKKSNEKVKDGS